MSSALGPRRKRCRTRPEKVLNSYLCLPTHGACVSVVGVQCVRGFECVCKCMRVTTRKHEDRRLGFARGCVAARVCKTSPRRRSRRRPLPHRDAAALLLGRVCGKPNARLHTCKHTHTLKEPKACASLCFRGGEVLACVAGAVFHGSMYCSAMSSPAWLLLHGADALGNKEH